MVCGLNDTVFWARGGLDVGINGVASSGVDSNVSAIALEAVNRN